MNAETPLSAPHRPRSALTVACWGAGLAGIPAIWLPFAWSTSPASALFDPQLWMLAAPFCLAVPIAAALGRWMQRGTLSRAEVRTAWALAGASAGLTLWVGAGGVASGELGSAEDWLILAIPLAVLGAGAVVVRRNRGTGRLPAGLNGIVAMEVAFVANAALCLLAFMDDLERGAYLALVAALAFASHATAASLARPGGARVGAAIRP